MLSDKFAIKQLYRFKQFSRSCFQPQQIFTANQKYFSSQKLKLATKLESDKSLNLLKFIQNTQNLIQIKSREADDGLYPQLKPIEQLLPQDVQLIVKQKDFLRLKNLINHVIDSDLPEDQFTKWLDTFVTTLDPATMEYLFQNLTYFTPNPMVKERHINMFAQSIDSEQIIEQIAFQSTVLGMRLDVNSYIKIMASLYKTPNYTHQEQTKKIVKSQTDKKLLLKFLQFTFKQDHGKFTQEFGSILVQEYLNNNNQTKTDQEQQYFDDPFNANNQQYENSSQSQKQKNKKRHQKKHMVPQDGANQQPFSSPNDSGKSHKQQQNLKQFTQAQQDKSEESKNPNQEVFTINSSDPDNEQSFQIIFNYNNDEQQQQSDQRKFSQEDLQHLQDTIQFENENYQISVSQGQSNHQQNQKDNQDQDDDNMAQHIQILFMNPEDQDQSQQSNVKSMKGALATEKNFVQPETTKSTTQTGSGPQVINQSKYAVLDSLFQNKKNTKKTQSTEEYLDKAFGKKDEYDVYRQIMMQTETSQASTDPELSATAVSSGGAPLPRRERNQSLEKSEKQNTTQGDEPEQIISEEMRSILQDEMGEPQTDATEDQAGKDQNDDQPQK